MMGQRPSAGAGGAPSAGAGGSRGGFGPAPPGANRALGRALAYLRAFAGDATGAVVALAIVSAATLAAPQLIRLAIDGGIAQRQPTVLALAVAGLVVVAAMRGLFTFLQGFLAERASQGVAYDLRDDLFAKIERLSFSYYDQAQTGQLLTRLTSDVEQVRAFVGDRRSCSSSRRWSCSLGSAVICSSAELAAGARRAG